MKIKSLQFKLENLRLSKPYKIAFKTVEHVENLFCLLETDQGILGYGACNPENEVAFISREKTLNTIEALDLDLLKHQSFDTPLEFIQAVRRMTGPVPTLLAAIEIAAWDAYGKMLDKPLSTILGISCAPLSTSVTIGIMDVQQTLEEAGQFVQSGFDHLKIKIGLDPQEDVERIIKLREKYRSGITIRADINQGYTLDDFKRFIALSAGNDIELYEQPLRTDQFAQVDDLPLEIKSKIAADESLLHLEDARDLIGHHRCGIFNIKLMKCGAWSQAGQIAQAAATHGIDLMWGCNDESRISIAAAMHMAYACANTKYLDLDGSFDLAYDPAQLGFEIQEGKMIPLDKPGLGIDWMP